MKTEKTNHRAYQRELDRLIAKNREAGIVPSLLLHSCCAPCSSYVLEYLSEDFSITDLYYNPNITEKEEYRRRADEMRRLIGAQPHLHPVWFVEGVYEPDRFFETVKGYEKEREGGARCLLCFRLRLEEAARAACGGYTDPADGRHRMYDFFTTTLPISPLKDVDAINRIGEEIAGECRARFGPEAPRWLPSDFRKHGGYARSIELSRAYGLYRQNYCGCVFSKRRDLLIGRRNDPETGGNP